MPRPPQQRRGPHLEPHRGRYLGASGAIYGVRLLQVPARPAAVEAHAVVSDAGWRTLQHECGVAAPLRCRPWPRPPAARCAQRGATLTSGSLRSHAMVVAPCSMRTLELVITAHGLSDNLLTRAADVMLKERRKLVLMVRETPLHLVHLRNMLTVTEMGAICRPPLPASTSTRAACKTWTPAWPACSTSSTCPTPWLTRWAGLPAPLATAS